MNSLVLKALAIFSCLIAAEYADARMRNYQSQTVHELTVYYSTKHDVELKIVLAIFMQESSMRVSAINSKSSDYGIGQINRSNIQRLGLDKHKLLHDAAYSIEQSILILKALKQRYAAKEPTNWWTRYHSFKPSHRTKYQLLVQRHMQNTKIAKER